MENNNPLKHTLRKLGDAPEISEESFRQLVQNIKALAAFTETVMERPFRVYNFGNGTCADRDWLDMVLTQFIKDCIETGASKETACGLVMLGHTFEPPVYACYGFIESYWQKINLRKLKQEQKQEQRELKRATTRKKAQGKVML